MTTESARSPVVRGEYPLSLPMFWRLDGAATEPEAPLVLCLHGMGMDEDFFARLLHRLFERPIRFLVPRGPYPVEVRGEGRIGASWYAYDGDPERFRVELDRTQTVLTGLVEQVEKERELRPRARAVLGFSQGGYCGSYLAVRRSDLFAGMIVSGARVKSEFLEAEMRAAASRGFRALLCHGEGDRSVSPEAAARSRDALAGAGVDVSLESFAGGHSLGRAQVGVMAGWLGELFGPPRPD